MTPLLPQVWFMSCTKSWYGEHLNRGVFDWFRTDLSHIVAVWRRQRSRIGGREGSAEQIDHRDDTILAQRYSVLPTSLNNLSCAQYSKTNSPNAIVAKYCPSTLSAVLDTLSSGGKSKHSAIACILKWPCETAAGFSRRIDVAILPSSEGALIECSSRLRRNAPICLIKPGKPGVCFRIAGTPYFAAVKNLSPDVRSIAHAADKTNTSTPCCRNHGAPRG
jgi:hypothetical protein